WSRKNQRPPAMDLQATSPTGWALGRSIRWRQAHHPEPRPGGASILSVPNFFGTSGPFLERRLSVIRHQSEMRDPSQLGPRCILAINESFVEPDLRRLDPRVGVVDAPQSRPIDRAEAHRAGLAARVDVASGSWNVPSSAQARRMATISACAVGSLLDVTSFQPSEMIVLFRTMTAPNGPPLFARIFSSASATARCMNACSVMTIFDPL